MTIDEVQSQIAAVLDQDEDTSSVSTDDYSLRLTYINRREKAWSEAGKWESLVKEYNTLTSTNSGNCSISLPSDFRTISSFPVIAYDGVNSSEFTQIRPQEESGFDSKSQKYVKILGNKNAGYTMVVNSANSDRQLSSGASIKVLYFSTPASHASPADVIYCPNPEYIVQGVVADIWEAQEDARFQGAKSEANIILSNMLEFENTPSEAAYNRQVRPVEQKYNYRWGK
jgi:hypothetical protein